jgi:osomolarity two-component system phosphorelay intermediate protein YPD1
MASPVRTTKPAVHTATEKPSTSSPSRPGKETPPSPVLEKSKPPQDVGKPAVHAAEVKAEEDEADKTEDEPEQGEPIDLETFSQILDLDEDDDEREFSRQMAWAYFSQVGDTFKEMDKYLEEEDVAKLSALGHFLKGSSAALGVSKLQESCEKIQHYGLLRDEERDINLTKLEAIKLIRSMLVKAKKDYVVAEDWLKKWYEEDALEHKS